jgi:hypothetical protein
MPQSEPALNESRRDARGSCGRLDNGLLTRVHFGPVAPSISISDAFSRDAMDGDPRFAAAQGASIDTPW